MADINNGFILQSNEPSGNEIYNKNNGQLPESNLAPITNDLNIISNQQHRWKIPIPSLIIQPPAYEGAQKGTTSGRNIAAKLPSAGTEVIFQTKRPISLNINNDHIQYDADDLGTSHSTRYNTSADFNVASQPQKSTTKTTNSNKYSSSSHKNIFLTTPLPSVTAPTTSYSQKTVAKSVNSNVKAPSKVYEPPFLLPVYNEKTTTAFGTTVITTTPRPTTFFQSIKTTSTGTTHHSANTSFTQRPLNTRLTTHAGKPFTGSTPPPRITFPSDIDNSSIGNTAALVKGLGDFRTFAPAQGFKSAKHSSSLFTTPSTSSSKFEIRSNSTNINGGQLVSGTAEPPIVILLPPFKNVVQHDVATTQGPPIYYEWKIPSNGLEPPKFDSPIGVNGREYPGTAEGYSDKTSQFNTKRTVTTSTSKEPFQKPTTQVKLPTGKDSAQTNELDAGNNYEKASASVKTPTAQLPPTASQAEISEIRKELSLPDFSFPLENVGRTGYLANNIYNSFQLKIPDGHDNAQEHWYGENPKCPECHPSYVIPGTCLPCLRKR